MKLIYRYMSLLCLLLLLFSKDISYGLEVNLTQSISEASISDSFSGMLVWQKSVFSYSNDGYYNPDNVQEFLCCYDFSSKSTSNILLNIPSRSIMIPTDTGNGYLFALDPSRHLFFDTTNTTDIEFYVLRDNSISNHVLTFETGTDIAAYFNNCLYYIEDASIGKDWDEWDWETDSDYTLHSISTDKGNTTYNLHVSNLNLALSHDGKSAFLQKDNDKHSLVFETREGTVIKALSGNSPDFAYLAWCNDSLLCYTKFNAQANLHELWLYDCATKQSHPLKDTEGNNITLSPNIKGKIYPNSDGTAIAYYCHITSQSTDMSAIVVKSLLTGEEFLVDQTDYFLPDNRAQELYFLSPLIWVENFR